MIAQYQFLISPSNRIAALLGDDVASVSILGSDGHFGKSLPLERFVQAYPDFSVVSLATKEEARTELDRRVENSQCLDLVLFLFDAELPIDLRREVSDELEPLLERIENRQYVLDIILSQPLPKAADIAGAQAGTASNPRATDLVLLICRSQKRVKSIYDAWLMLQQQEPLLKTIARNAFLGMLIELGVFRRLVSDVRDKESLNALKASVALDAKLTARFVTSPRILSRWFELIGDELPSEPASRRALEEPGSDIDDIASERRQPARRSVAHTARDAAVSQVEQIVDLFAKERDQRAREVLEQVLSSNLADARGEKHAVKTLCNVASKATARGRKDVSSECLARALAYPTGCDAVLYFQIGNEYRDLCKREEALWCFRRAEELTAGTDADFLRIIRNSKIHVLTIVGEYDEALSNYFAIPDYNQEPTTLCAIGDVFRKKGELEDAKRHYEACLGLARDNYRAVAGLAEVLKQKGKFHRAIRKYNSLLQDFSALDDKSIVVYRLALARLFRFVGQNDKAKRILLDLYENSPRHPDVNLQLAILYEILGDTQHAAKHRDLADTGESDRMRLSILEQAMQHRRGGAPSVLERDEIDFDTGVMPEDVGLAQCAHAFFNIAHSQCAEVVPTLNNTRFVDRIIENLSDVLKLHALTSNRLEVSSDLQRSIYVLAKRGDRSLRNAISAIRSRAFLDAQRFEAELLLRAA